VRKVGTIEPLATWPDAHAPTRHRHWSTDVRGIDRRVTAKARGAPGPLRRRSAECDQGNRDDEAQANHEEVRAACLLWRPAFSHRIRTESELRVGPCGRR
jgi:hypothetical protein